MIRKTLLLTFYAIIIPSGIIYAQVNDLTFSKLETRALSIENPFKSQLPKIEEPEIEIPEDIPSPNKNQNISTNIMNKPSTPNIPEPKPETPLPKVTINGIIWDSDRPQAIINEQIVDVGDNILGIQIIGIQKEGIEGLFNGRHVNLQP